MIDNKKGFQDLHTYFMNSAGWRVRIAAAIKGWHVEIGRVWSLSGSYWEANLYMAAYPHNGPITADEFDRSLHLMYWMEEMCPDHPALFSVNGVKDADMERVVHAIVADEDPLIHLLQFQNGQPNPAVLEMATAGTTVAHLTREQSVPDYQRMVVVRVRSGLAEFERALESRSGKFCFGDTVTAADVMLVPRVYNARRFGMKVEAYPSIARVYGNCRAHPAFANTQPARQRHPPPGTAEM